MATNINQLIACAMVECKSLSEAAKILDCPQDVLCDAVAYRMNIAVDYKIDDYQQSLFAAFKRLEEAN